MPRSHVEASNVAGAEMRPNKQTGKVPGLGKDEGHATRWQEHFSGQVRGQRRLEERGPGVLGAKEETQPSGACPSRPGLRAIRGCVR